MARISRRQATREGRAAAAAFKAAPGATFGISIQVRGQDEIIAALRKYPKQAEKVFTKACNDSARLLAEVGRGSSRTPVDTGRMRASISHRKLGRLAAATFVGVRYGIFVHEGTRYMKGRPFFKWYLKGGAQKAIDLIFKRALHKIP